MREHARRAAGQRREPQLIVAALVGDVHQLRAVRGHLRLALERGRGGVHRRRLAVGLARHARELGRVLPLLVGELPAVVGGRRLAQRIRAADDQFRHAAVEAYAPQRKAPAARRGEDHRLRAGLEGGAGQRAPVARELLDRHGAEVEEREVLHADRAGAHEHQPPAGRRERRLHVPGHSNDGIGDAGQLAGIDIDRDQLARQARLHAVREDDRATVGRPGQLAERAEVAVGEPPLVLAVRCHDEHRAARVQDALEGDQAAGRRPRRELVAARALRQRPPAAADARSQHQVRAAAVGELPAVDELAAVGREARARLLAGLDGERHDVGDDAEQHHMAAVDQLVEAQRQAADHERGEPDRQPVLALARGPGIDRAGIVLEHERVGRLEPAPGHRPADLEHVAISRRVRNPHRAVLGEHPAQQAEHAAQFGLVVLRRTAAVDARGEFVAVDAARGPLGEDQHRQQRLRIERDDAIRARHAPERGPHAPRAEVEVGHARGVRRRRHRADRLLGRAAEGVATAEIQVAATLHGAPRRRPT